MAYQLTVTLNKENLETEKLVITVETRAQAKAINESLKATNNINVSSSKLVEL